MSGQEEDMNTFSSWDCFGATLMLGVTPAIIHYATTDPHDEAGAVWIALIGILIAAGVLIVALVTRWRFLSTLINAAGWGLTLYFIFHMTLFWSTSCSRFGQDKELKIETTTQPQGEKPRT